jgi:membrane-bound ClpP family serine protease
MTTPNDNKPKLNAVNGNTFIAIGAAFIAIGIITNRAFLPIGIVVIVIGIVMLARQRKP